MKIMAILFALALLLAPSIIAAGLQITEIDVHVDYDDAFTYRVENSLLKNQILEYREFIHSLVAQNAIMQKTFFIVVPYDPLNLPGAGLAVTDKILGWFKTKSDQTQTKTENTSEALEQLEQRVDHVIQGVNQIGLRAVTLNEDELIELFYNLYNPATTEKKGVDINADAKK